MNAFYTGQAVTTSYGAGRIVRKQGAHGYMVRYSRIKPIDVGSFGASRIVEVTVIETSFFRTASIQPATSIPAPTINPLGHNVETVER